MSVLLLRLAYRFVQLVEEHMDDQLIKQRLCEIREGLHVVLRLLGYGEEL